MRVPTLTFLLLPLLLVPACGGGGGGGASPPPITPNKAPVLQVPNELTGSGGAYRYLSTIAEVHTIQFAATDADGDALHWQVVGDPAVAAAAGVTLPLAGNGNTFQVAVAAVAVPTSADLVVFVEDARGGAGAIDLQIVRTGAPAITGVAPDSAFVGRAQAVTVTGTGFWLGGTVTTVARFGGQLGTSTLVTGDTSLACNTPSSLAAGPVAVSVDNLQGSSSLPGTAFTAYSFPPSFASADTAFDSGAGDVHAVARDGAVLHAVWLEAGAVVHRASADHGATWGAAQTLSGFEVPTEPQVVCDGVEVVVTWIGDGTTVRTRRSADTGTTFDAAVVVNPSGILPASRLRLAATGAQVYAAWTVGSAGSGTARLATASSSDGGATWGAPLGVDDQNANQTAHVLACAGGTAWLLFRDERQGAGIGGAYVARSGDGGATWSAATRLSAAGVTTGSPCLANDGLRLHAAWLVGGTLRHTTSANGGINWTNSIELQSAANGAVTAPVIACSGARFYAAYVVGTSTVQVTRITAIGAAPADIVLTSAATSPAELCLAARGNYVVAAFRDGSVGGGTARIRQCASGNLGAQFSTPATFGDGAGTSQEAPVLAADSASIVLLWKDHRAVTPGLFVNRNQ